MSVALLLSARSQALSITEYCPAQISDAHPIAAKAGKAAIYAYDLQAFGARNVRGDVVVQTSDEWYTFGFPSEEITGEDVRYQARWNYERYHAPWSNFTRREFRSPMLYVSFPKPVAILRWWVSDAAATDDGVFGWDDRGPVPCSPTVDTDIYGTTSNAEIDRLSSGPNWVPPSPGTTLMDAAEIAQPPGASSCANPFAEAAVKFATVDYPLARKEGRAHVLLIVAIGADGELDDVWVYAPSGLSQLDAAAIDAARRSSFHSAIALCENVPSYALLGIVY